jgi:hypothetical protein
MFNITNFWDLIEYTKRASGGDADKQAELLITELSKLADEDIVGYQVILTQQMDRAYNRDLWAAAYIINCGCSDDGFMDFRAWLIAQGRLAFEMALDEPEMLSEIVNTSTTTQIEKLLYVASNSYRNKTGQEMPAIPHELPKLTGEEWTEDMDSLKRKYPKLHAKFGDCAKFADF